MLPSIHLYFYVTKSGEIAKLEMGFGMQAQCATAILNRKREVIGYRSMLVYYNNALNTNTKKRDRSEKTRWILLEYTFPEAHNMSSKGHKEPFWTICKIGKTGRTFGGDNYQSSSVPSQQQQQPLQQQLNMELMGPHHQQEVDQQLQLQQSECDDGRSLVLMEDDLPLCFGSTLMITTHLRDDDQEWIENLESILEPQQQSELIVLPDDEDDACNEDMENWIGNFNYCMDMIKELHDEVYDVNGNSELEIDEQPFPKRVKY
ncbi:hypothetical protein Sjap_005541 [Stephania japonica]|uniref:NAC domain-containing protein n=1 Tax=Stephania japonica TaxID=461633 RepID=A0AAP0K5T1_9MAGN